MKQPPRLRISRHSNDASNATMSTPQAGPSRLPELTQLMDVNLSNLDGFDSNDDDRESTPKITSVPSLASSSPVDTPAARLRALLSRVPTRSPTTPLVHPRSSPSELESDYEAPQPPPSVARESLKDIFSRALRDPGDTPRKAARRRNSIDMSEVDAGPRVERDQMKNKGKRKSLSDDEVENSRRMSCTPFKSDINPITLDIHDSSHVQLEYEGSSPLDNTSNDTASILRDLNSSRTAPAATSTPQVSLRMSGSSQYPFHSNLLDQDSEMQRAIEGLDSFDGGLQDDQPEWVPPSQSAPDTRHERPKPSPSNKPRKSGTPSRLMRPTSRSSMSSSSSHSRSGSFKENEHGSHERDQNNVLTRPNTPDPARGVKTRDVSSRLSRHGSSNSLHDFDDMSIGSSVGSQAEYRERIRELERERNVEREREWNKRHPQLTRPKSSLSLHSPTQHPRVRTQSFSPLTRQESETSLLSPENRSGLRRHHSFNSSRGASPSGSWTSQDEDPETVHERERNWNSPRPKWHDHPPAKHGSLSPTSPSGHSPYPHPPAKGRLHTESQNISMSSANGVHQQHNTPSPQEKGRSKRLSLPSPPPVFPGRESPSGSYQNTKPPHRTTTSSLLPVSKDNGHSHGSAANLGYGLVRNRTFLPPLDRDHESPQRSHLRPHTPTSSSAPVKKGSFKESHIPVRSPRKTNVPRSALQDDDFTLDANHLFKQQSLPSIEAADMHSENGKFGQDMDGSCTDATDDPSQERTPTLLTVPPPPLESTPSQPSAPPSRTPLSDELRLQNALASHISDTILQEYSPPPSAPEEPLRIPSPLFSSTPPRESFRKPTLHTTPPKDLPDLPDPPSTDEEDSEPLPPKTHTALNGGSALELAETPRAPGGWAATPAPARNTNLASDYLQGNGQGVEESTHISDINNINWTAMKTPKPPGSWNTFATPIQAPQFDSPSIENSSVPVETNGGLATPVASISKASLAFQTPAAPGAWVATPATRKSILKVRFDPQASKSDDFTAEDVPEHSTYDVMNSSESNIAANSAGSDTRGARPSTPELLTLISPGCSPHNPRKSPSIRILDAFGREQTDIVDAKPDPSNSARSSSTKRVPDAMDREVDEDEDETFTAQSDHPMNRDELLSRVRRGLGDIVQGIDELSHIDDDPPHHLRVQELETVSKLARQRRKHISQRLGAVNVSLVGSLTNQQLMAPINNMVVRIHSSPCRFLCILLLQIIFLLFMYRLSIMHAKNLFLTTYYDPFYPDLHLYTSKPHILYSIPSSSRASWFSRFDITCGEGWKKCSANAAGNFYIFLGDLQNRIWEQWGSEVVHNSWPPT